MSLRKLRAFSVFLLITVVVHLAIIRSGIFLNNQNIGTNTLADNVWDILKKDYLYKDRIDQEKIFYGGISGEVASLGDPYTVFLSPQDNKTSRENLAGEFGGVGVSLGYKNGMLVVMTPLAKTPAERAGLLSGDVIMSIKDVQAGIDVETSEINISRAVELIRGEVGTKVTLTIFREDRPEPFEVDLIRENIVVASVELEEINISGKKVPWVKMYKFSDRLYEEWDQLVNKIVGSSSDTVILDLRNNPGGYLDGSVVIASDFLKTGVVVKQKTADGRIKEYSVIKDKARLADKNLIVLINEGSASAAEILAGALRQGMGTRAKILGQTSFGKGTVQKTEDFPDGSGLHLTIAKWLLPDGGDIDGVGVKPDVEVKWKYDDSDIKSVIDYIENEN